MSERAKLRTRGGHINMKLAALLVAAALMGLPTPVGAAGEEPVVPAFEGGFRTVRVQATAYTSGPESTGKRPGHPAFGVTSTGARARAGRTIAVDPRMIPLGSRIDIAGIGGEFIAEDTGGAIRGRRIDLYMDDVDDALEWGVREVEIQVFPQI
jgi:3D (Asp-Asp-Asp) domain-containing protein